MQPETRYAKSGEVHIAYQVVGDGPLDLVFVPGFISHLELDWDGGGTAQFFRRLASFSRLIRFDKRGTGLSDRVAGGSTLEERMDDVRAVMDAVGSERAALFGVSEGGSMSILFASTYPERTEALVLYGAYARRLWAPNYPWGRTAEQWEEMLDTMERDWGGPTLIGTWAPSMAGDQDFARGWASYMRLAASPGAALAIQRMAVDFDLRDILPAICVPTRVLHRRGDLLVHPYESRYIAERIPGATYIELDGDDHIPWVGDDGPILDEVEQFLTGTRRGAEPDRVLATILFTDIVASTDHATRLGDRRWRVLLDTHHHLVRRALSRFRGHEVHTTGDGFLATFDGPARAIRCAIAIRQEVRQLGIELRAGVHTGEIELMGDDVGGLAVHIGARVSTEAGPSEVLVSSTVKDLVVGSGIDFEDRGIHALKGVPGEWRLFRVMS